MTPFPRGILFSDVDGTFLDAHYTPVLRGAALHAALDGWRLVFVSSRTAAELYALHAAIGYREDAIGENGGVLLSYDASRAAAFGVPRPHQDAWIVELARPIADVRAHAAPLVAAVEGLDVSMLSASAMAARSGYSVADAERALARHTSMLISVDTADAERLAAALQPEGYTLVHGGRWVSILHGSDKGRAASQWQRVIAPDAVSVAVGDAANDAALLAVVDHPFVIADPVAGPAPTLLAIPRARPLTALGTLGWLELVATLPGFLSETP
jgi:HAD superfamily hydrolase (TIGR01484 family)